MTTSQSERLKAQPQPDQEHVRSTGREEVLTARSELREILLRIAGELVPQQPGCTLLALIQDTRGVIVHADALLAATDRQLTRLERTERAARRRKVRPTSRTPPAATSAP